MVGAMQPVLSLQGDQEPHPRVSFCSICEWLSTSAVSHKVRPSHVTTD